MREGSILTAIDGIISGSKIKVLRIDNNGYVYGIDMEGNLNVYYHRRNFKFGMDRKTYADFIKANPDTTKGDVIKELMCLECNRCKNQKMINVCLCSLDLVVKLWN